MKKIKLNGTILPHFVIFHTMAEYTKWRDDENYEYDFRELRIGHVDTNIEYPVDRIERIYRYDGGESYAVRLYSTPRYNERIDMHFPTTKGMIIGWALSHKYFDEIIT